MIDFINPRHDKKTEEVIIKFRKKHGDRYNYALVVFFKSIIKVRIICREHGMFEQRPDVHLYGSGCARCGKGSKSATISTEELIVNFNKVHGIGTYDYSEVEHTSLEQKVEIICPKHTWFFQTPHSHLRGEGCPCCAGRFPADERTRAEVYSEIHKNKYDYSSMDLENVKLVRRQQSFICKEHGVFKLILSQHLHRGCPTCENQAKDIEHVLPHAKSL